MVNGDQLFCGRSSIKYEPLDPDPSGDESVLKCLRLALGFKSQKVEPLQARRQERFLPWRSVSQCQQATGTLNRASTDLA
jgi:hypothetical protein